MACDGAEERRTPSCAAFLRARGLAVGGAGGGRGPAPPLRGGPCAARGVGRGGPRGRVAPALARGGGGGSGGARELP